jgi:hypothetical protein
MSEEQNQFIGMVPRSVVRIWLARLGMVVFCAVCLALVWWSLIVRLQPANKVQRERALAASRLADEVDQLQLKLSAEPAEQIEARYKAAQGLLFATKDQILDWEDDTTHQAADLGLNVKIELSPARPFPGLAKEVNIVEASIDITPIATGFTNTPYQRMLQFIEIMVDTGKRCDLMTLSAEGNFNSIQHARAVVQLLAEPKGVN